MSHSRSGLSGGVVLALAGAALSAGCGDGGDGASPTGLAHDPASFATTASVPTYRVIPIAASIGWRLNESGDVVGWTAGNQPFLYTAEDGVIILPTSSSRPSGLARDVSERAGGEVVVVGRGLGDSFTGLHALRWRVAVPGGTVLEVTDLGTLPGIGATEARGINESGEIAGLLDPESLSGRAFYFSDATGMVDLGLGGLGSLATAHDVNAAGVVAGYQGGVAFRWTRAAGAEYLGVPSGFALSFGFALNDAGQVSGAATSATGNSERIARYTDGVGWEILGGVGETNLGWGINALGDVVGEGRADAGGPLLLKGVIYTAELGQVRYVDDFVATDPPSEWRVMAAFDINDARQITGWATNIVVGGSSAVLLTPVDAPPPPPPPNLPPLADFTMTCDANLLCTFDGTDSSDPDGTIAAYLWLRPNGTTWSTAPVFTQQFTKTGTGNVTLTVTDDDGATGTVTRTVTVAPGEPPPDNQPPTASFTWSCAGLTCTFDGTGSVDPDGTIATYEWLRSNGTVWATGPTFTFTFQRAGSGTVTLRVTDDDGAQASQAQTVTTG